MTSAPVPPSSAALTKYIAEHGDLPKDFLLGRIVLSTIADETPVKHSDLVKWMKQLGLDLAYVPAENRALDAFKKATKDQEGTRYDLAGGRTAHVMCREVNETPMLLRRQITREIRDVKSKVLDYSKAKVLDCMFSKPSKPGDQKGARIKLTVEQANLEPGEARIVKGIGVAIQERYMRYLEFLDGSKLRAMVRTYLKKKLNAMEMRGGVYFVQLSYDEELSALAALVKRFGGEMTTISVADLPREREYYTSVLKREATQAAREFVEEVQALTVDDNKRVNSTTAARYSERYAQMVANWEEHLATLQPSKNVATTAMEQAKRELAKLQRKASGS